MKPSGGAGLRRTRTDMLAHQSRTLLWWLGRVRSGSPLFLYRRGFPAHVVDLGAERPERVSHRPVHKRVELDGGQRRIYAFCLSWDDPGVANLEAELPV